MKIGIVTLDVDLRQVLQAQIQTGGHETIVFDNLLRALEAEPDLIFAQWGTGENLPELLDGLRIAAGRSVLIPVVVLVPAGSVALMQRAKTAGAADVLFTPPDSEEVAAEIEEARGEAGALDITFQERFRELRRHSLIGEAANFHRCLNDLKLAARCDANVLLIGETGTGKEMFTQAIHHLSRRAGNPFIAVNCASLPGGLLETELFGHVKGAFTGADTPRAGRFEAVGAGTLLLDEIGDIEFALQVKLLRVIEQRVFQRVGDNKDIRFNARLVCATSVNLETAVAEGRFRQDLLGRIDQFRISLPALRERRSDTPKLAAHFLRKHARGRLVEISKSAMEMLEAHDFPMNIRQLENALVSALARSDPGQLILPKHLPEEITTPHGGKGEKPRRAISLPENMNYKQAREYVVQALDDQYLSDLLRKHGGNQTRAAEEAGIDRKTFSARVEHAHGIEEGTSDG